MPNPLSRLALPLLLFSAFAAAAMAQGRAEQVRQILTMTRANWVAVREYEGQDLVYFTHIESWRCGLSGLKYGINSEVADQVRQLEPCAANAASPAPIAEDHLPYITLPLGSVQSITIELIYEDGATDSTTFARAAIQIQ